MARRDDRYGKGSVRDEDPSMSLFDAPQNEDDEVEEEDDETAETPAEPEEDEQTPVAGIFGSQSQLGDSDADEDYYDEFRLEDSEDDDED